jgi:hypothetical protein
MTSIQASQQRTVNATKPVADQAAGESQVAHQVAYGTLPAEWARAVATLSAVNRVLLTSSQRLIGHQMELAQGVARDMVPGTPGDRLQRSSQLAVAYGAGLGSLVHSSNCEIAAILGQYHLESMRGLTAGVEKALATAP